MSYGPALENALYVHLRSKGYEVSVGIIGKLECDFIVRKRERYAYVQVSMSVQDPNVEEREFRPFTKLADGYPKYLFSLDQLPMQRDGIRHLNLMEFLRTDGDLDLSIAFGGCYFAYMWQILGFARMHFAYMWQFVFETSQLGGNFAPSNCGFSGMTCHI